MADPMTTEQLTEIRQRLAATTAGPWTARDLYIIAPGDVHIADFEWLANTDEEWAEFKANTTFAAAARQDVPALLAEVERLRAELAERDQRLDQAAQDEARITHEWDQARIAIERMGRVLDGTETT